MREVVERYLRREDSVGALMVTTAMVRLYSWQTAAEKEQTNTHQRNSAGFSSADAKLGSFLARMALGATAACPYGVVTPEQWDIELVRSMKGKQTPIRILYGRYLPMARKLALKYAGQLAKEAERRKERKVA